jgi:hypothetical protein
MGAIDATLISKLTQAGPRLPSIKKWLMESVWSQERYDSLGPLSYLQNGEAAVNEFEKLISATADRVYYEFLERGGKNRDILAVLAEPSTAVVIFDGMSVRELPMLLSLAKKSGFRIVEQDYGVSAVPSETLNFIEQRLGCPQIGPSQLPGRKELTEKGIRAFYLSSHTQSLNTDSPKHSILVWSAFPDNTYADTGARFDKHFEQICHQLETAWIHNVQQIKGIKKIVVTSDHGYTFLDSGLSFERSRTEIGELNRFFGNNRCRKITDTSELPVSGDVFVGNDYAMIKGRVHTRSTGTAASHLYKHGGMSLMECFTPWLVLELK